MSDTAWAASVRATEQALGLEQVIPVGQDADATRARNDRQVVQP